MACCVCAPASGGERGLTRPPSATDHGRRFRPIGSDLRCGHLSAVNHARPTAADQRPVLPARHAWLASCVATLKDKAADVVYEVVKAAVLWRPNLKKQLRPPPRGVGE